MSLPLVGTGLVAFAVADSGFVYLTTAGTYSSGSLIDIGWFLGFALMLGAAVVGSRYTQARADADDGLGRQIGTFLPYAAVTAALLTSVIDSSATEPPTRSCPGGPP